LVAFAVRVALCPAQIDVVEAVKFVTAGMGGTSPGAPVASVSPYIQVS
jgi:hypothetical protein